MPVSMIIIQNIFGQPASNTLGHNNLTPTSCGAQMKHKLQTGSERPLMSDVKLEC